MDFSVLTPKRNLTAFLHYYHAIRNRVKEENPDKNFGDVAKIISDEFKALSEAERTKWDKIAAEDKERYQREMELKYEFLYTHGLERPEGDSCPICTLPIPLPTHEHSKDMACCSKRVCNGCGIAAQLRGIRDCAFCRTPLAKYIASALAMARKRVEART